ncbi:aromatic amino acid lyase [Streptomyces xylophagus]|uniref:aromatic amino acid lyase n=1 Tax=Streptomyces xylophagus TaxID=285514 RepID=UPI00099617A3|nr:aromatic amino acid lyase [Streptomyces xylophagus]
MTEVVVDGRTLSYGDVVAVAHHGAQVALADGVLSRLVRERAIVDDVVDRQVPTYGLTTGLGARSSYALPRAELDAFSVRTVRGRANAVGDPLPVTVVRAALLARVNGLAGGGSGVRPEIPRLLVDLLNARVHPVIPEVGSIGASDLCQMAHVGLVVIGEGSAECGGEVLDGATALRRAGLIPARLGPKDGHVLCSASPLAAGVGALALHEAGAVLALAQAVTALTYEGFRANTSPLDPRVLGLRPAPGQSRAAAELLALLDGGELGDPRNARRVQDPVSLRCAAQVHGAAYAALDFADAALMPELNGCGDNPVVLGGVGGGAEGLSGAGAGAEGLSGAGAGAEELSGIGADTEGLSSAGADTEGLSSAGADTEGLSGIGADAEGLSGAGDGTEELSGTEADAEELSSAGDGSEVPTGAGAGPRAPTAAADAPKMLTDTGDEPQAPAPAPPGTGEILSSGNFHTPALALAYDTLALALTQTASISAERMRRLLDPAVSGLPANLSPYGPERSGFAPLVKTAQALVAEIRMLSTPVCTDPRQGADSVEDDSTNAALGARRLTTMLGRLRQLLAVEAVVAAQAVDLTAPAALGRGPEFLHRAIRKLVPTLNDDRPHGVDVETVSRDILGSDDVRSTLNALAGEVT